MIIQSSGILRVLLRKFFHQVLMNIFFSENLVLLAILFTPITEWLARFLSNDPRTESDNSRRLDAGGVNP